MLTEHDEVPQSGRMQCLVPFAQFTMDLQNFVVFADAGSLDRFLNL